MNFIEYKEKKTVNAVWSIIVISLSDQTTELKTRKRQGKQPESMNNSAKMTILIILSTGVVLTVVLLMLISCTYCKCFTSANVNGNNPDSQNVQEMDTVYAEISRRRIWKNHQVKLWLFCCCLIDGIKILKIYNWNLKYL